MDVLHELAKIAPAGLRLSPTEKKYFKLLQSGVSIEEARKKIFGNSPDASTKISRLGYEIKRKVIADIATENTKKNNSYADLATEAHQLFATGRILMGRQAYRAGAELLEKAYDKAQSAQLIGLALEIAKPLADYFSTMVGDGKKYEFYQQAINELIIKNERETQVLSYHREIQYQFTYSWHPDLAAKAYAYCAITENYINTSLKSANAHFYMLALANVADLDFSALVQTCEEAINYFSKLKNPPKTPIFNYYLKKAVAYIQLQQFQEAIAATDYILNATEPGKFSYVSAYYYRAIAGLHAGNIQWANDAIDKTDNYLKNVPQSLQEQWRIVIAYTALFSERKYKIGKFINEVPIFSKDKAGANAAIIIVQMLHYLKMGKTNEYIERCDALHRYTSRYLKGKAKILAKLLLEVSKGHFNANTIEYRTRKLVKELDGQERELAVMPAEKVWKLVMDWLR